MCEAYVINTRWSNSLSTRYSDATHIIFNTNQYDSDSANTKSDTEVDHVVSYM